MSDIPMSNDSIEDGAVQVVEKDQDVDSSLASSDNVVDFDAGNNAESELDDAESEPDAAEIREFVFGESKLSVSADSITDEIADKIHRFSDEIASNHAKSKKDADVLKDSLTLQDKALRNLSTLNDEALNVYSQGLRLKEDIAQLSQVDLNPLWQSNPDQARRISDALGRKQAELQSVIAQVGQREQAMGLAHEEETARRQTEGRAILDRKYNNFSSEKSPALIKYAVSKGMDSHEANNWALNPIVAEMAYKAMLYEQMQSQVKNKPKLKQVVAPVKASKVKGNSTSGVKDLGKMSMAEYAKWRNVGSG